MSLLEVRHLCAGYGKRRILEDISFSLAPGELVGVLGENGSGKTTLLKSVCGILPHRGECLLGGENREDLSSRQLARTISYIPQRSGISIDLSALEVVLMGFNPQLRLLESPNAAMKRRAGQALEAVGLGGRGEENFQSLSQGQQQLCILARTLVSQAEVLLLDEPESALDFGGRYRMLGQLQDFLGREKAALVTLHDPQLALNRCHRLLLLSGGKLMGEIFPGRSSLRDMESALEKLYGELSLSRVDGQYVLIPSAK